MSEMGSSSKNLPRKDLFPQMESVLQEHATGIKVFSYEDDEVLCLSHFPMDTHRNEDKLSTSSLNIIEKLKKRTSTNDIPIDIINVMDRARVYNESQGKMNKEKCERFKLFRSTSSVDAKRCALCCEERNKLSSSSYASTEKTYPKTAPLMVPKNNYVQQMQPLIEDTVRNDCSQQFQNYQNDAVLQQQQFLNYPNQYYEVGQSSPMMANYQQEYVQSPVYSNSCYQNNAHQVYNAPTMMAQYPPLMQASYSQTQQLPVGASYNGAVTNQNYHQVYGSFTPQVSEETRINYFQNQPVNSNVAYQTPVAPQPKYVVPPLVLNEESQKSQASINSLGRHHHQVKNENSAYKLIMKPVKEDVSLKPKKLPHKTKYTYDEDYREYHPLSRQQQQENKEYEKSYNHKSRRHNETKKIDDEDSSNDDYEEEVPKKHYHRRSKKAVYEDEDFEEPKTRHRAKKEKNCPRYEGNVVDNDDDQKKHYRSDGKKEKRDRSRKSEKIQNQEEIQSQRNPHAEIRYESKKEKKHHEIRKEKELERKDVENQVKKSNQQTQLVPREERFGYPLPEAIEIKVMVDPKFIRQVKKQRKSIKTKKKYNKTSMDLNQDLLETKTFSDLDDFYSSMEVPRTIRIETNKSLYKDIDEERLKNNNVPLVGLWYHNKLFEKIPSPRCRRSSKYPLYYKASRLRTNYVRETYRKGAPNLIPISVIKTPSSEVYSDFDCSSLTSEDQDDEDESEEDEVVNDVEDGVEEDETEEDEEEEEEDEEEEEEVEDESEEEEVEGDEVEDEAEEDEVKDDEIEGEEISHCEVYGSKSKKGSKLKVTFAKSLEIAESRSNNEEINEDEEDSSSDVEEDENVKIDQGKRVSQHCKDTEVSQLKESKKTKTRRVSEMVQKFESNITKTDDAQKVKKLHKNKEKSSKKHKFVEKCNVNCDGIQSNSSLYEVTSLPTDITLQQVPTPENENIVYTAETFKQTIRQYVISIYELQNAPEEVIDAKYEEFKNACYQMGYGHYFETYQIPVIKQEPGVNLQPQEYLTQQNINQQQYLKSEGYLGGEENLRQEENFTQEYTIQDNLRQHNLKQDNLGQDYLIQEEILRQEVYPNDLNLNADENQKQVAPPKPTKLRVKKSRKSSNPVQKCGVQERVCNQSTSLG